MQTRRSRRKARSGMLRRRTAPVAPAILLALLCSALPSVAEFWDERPYGEWTREECQRLITRSTQRAYPWKKDLGRSGAFSRGAVVWYSDTVWRAFFRYRERSEQEMMAAAAQCSPGLLLVIYFAEPPGGRIQPFKPVVSPGDIVGQTYLETDAGASIRPSPRAPGCMPYVDKFTIVLNFPLDQHLTGALARAHQATFVCPPLGVQEVFDLDAMRAGQRRDTHWRSTASQPVREAPRSSEPEPAPRKELAVVQPLPFKRFNTDGDR